LRDVFLHPSGEFGCACGVEGDEFFEAQVCGGTAVTVEDAADGDGDLGALVLTRDVGLDVLLEMELATLPGHGVEDGLACGFETEVIVTGDELDAGETALGEALEEGAPVNLGLAEGDADTEDGAFAFGIDAHGDEDGAIADLAVESDFFVTGIKDQIGERAEGTVAPFLEFCVEESGAVADLGGTDGVAAELFDDGGDFASGDALDVHFGEGEQESLFGAAAFFEGTGVPVQFAADLGDIELEVADASGEGFVFKTVGVAGAEDGALVGMSLEGVRTLLKHGLVDEEAEAFGETLSALFGDELQDGVQEIRIGLVGHVWFWSWMCLRHPNRKPA
jgi:hypothetical protein